MSIYSPTPQDIQQANDLLERLALCLGNHKEALNLVAEYDQENGNILDTLATPGAVDITGSNDRVKTLLWIGMAARKPECLYGYLSNAVGAQLDHMKDTVMTATLLDDNCRSAYLLYIKQWSRKRQHEGDSIETTSVAIAEELGSRMHELTSRHLREDLGTKAKATYTELLEPLGEVGPQTMLDSLLFQLCNTPPGRLDDGAVRAERAGQLVHILVELGADPHTPSEYLVSDKRHDERVDHPNLLHQVLWLRHTGGMGPQGGQGERDPLINSLIDAQADWRAALDTQLTNEAMRNTLLQHEAVRRALLHEVVQENIRPEHTKKRL